MMRLLQHLRDFLDEEALKYLPGRLMTGQFILLQGNRGGKSRPAFPLCDKCKKILEEKGNVTYCKNCIRDQKDWDKEYPPGEPWRQVIHVFDQGGTFIGTIENPDWIPKV